MVAEQWSSIRRRIARRFCTQSFLTISLTFCLWHRTSGAEVNILRAGSDASDGGLALLMTLVQERILYARGPR